MDAAWSGPTVPLVFTLFSGVTTQYQHVLGMGGGPFTSTCTKYPGQHPDQQFSINVSRPPFPSPLPSPTSSTQVLGVLSLSVPFHREFMLTYFSALTCCHLSPAIETHTARSHPASWSVFGHFVPRRGPRRNDHAALGNLPACRYEKRKLCLLALKDYQSLRVIDGGPEPTFLFAGYLGT